MGKQFTLTAADKHRLGAYRADPQGPAKGGIVVVQEIFGVNHHIRAVCDRLADEGYAAVAPALFDRLEPNFECGYTPDEIANARKFVANPDFGAMLRDIQAAIDELKKEGPVAILGFCLGGTISFLAAAEGNRPLGGGLLLWRPHHQDRRQDAEMPDPDAFRREGCQHPDERRGDDQEEASRMRDLTSIRMPGTASIATNAAATTRRPPSSPGSARWSFSRST